MIDGLDVSGLTFAVNVFIPGNPLEGNWRAQLYIDERASPKEQAALLGVFTGKQGGPVADQAALVGEEISGVSFGHPTRRVLRRLLLVPDAADVRHRLRQYRLDAGAGRGRGGRKEPTCRRRLAAPIGAHLLLATVWVALTGATA